MFVKKCLIASLFFGHNDFMIASNTLGLVQSAWQDVPSNNPERKPKLPVKPKPDMDESTVKLGEYADCYSQHYTIGSVPAKSCAWCEWFVFYLGLE